MSGTPESAQLQAKMQEQLQAHYNTPGNKRFIRASSEVRDLYRDYPNNNAEFYRAVYLVFGPFLGAAVIMGLTRNIREVELFRKVGSGDIATNEELTQQRAERFRFEPMTQAEIEASVAATTD